MLEFKYEIKIDDNGRPYIYLPDDYDNKPEDKFMTMELTRLFLLGPYFKRATEMDENTSKNVKNTIELLGDVSDEIAAIIFDMMKFNGDVKMSLNSKYNIIVNTIEERNNLKNFVSYDNAIYEIKDGLKVLVKKNNTIYVLNNNKWNKVKE